jgi:transmembrane sensor
MDPSNEYAQLMVRVLSGDATHDEEELLRQWMASSPDNAKYFDDLRTLWEQSGKSVQADDSLLNADWKKTLDRITHIRETERPASRPTRTLHILMRVAASLLLFIGVFYSIQKFYQPQVTLVTQAEIRTVTLPDGSEVTLNANSTLSYPREFKAGLRTVSLEGEAFFNIRRDSLMPFIIETGNTATEVLGTSFSVKAQADSVVVTVLTGKVLFYHDRGARVTLTPGERGVYAKDLLTERINTDRNFLSWQTNTLDFSNATLTTFAHDIARHFNVQVEISPALRKTCTITAQFRDQDLREILDEVKLLFPVTIQMRGDTILIDGKGCAQVN